ncbi:hypothetical protein GCM10023213_48780 [Prosthecobacter algae]|uniref:Uncharacterized protein n=2 Tax=Prosthecobacter algae TaxID=1144682 RepID=A0ABP9PUT2_9BACT
MTMAPEITAYLSSGSVTEFGTLTGTSAQVTGFTDFVKGNWNAILNDLDTVAPDERRQRLLICAAESLSPSDYMDFLALLLDKHQENKVKKAVAIAALSPAARKYGFLAFNDQHPQVRALCERAKTIFADVADLQDLMNETLSGEQRKQIGAALASENRAQPEILPTP